MPPYLSFIKFICFVFEPFPSQRDFHLENYQIRISFRETLIDKIPVLIKLHCNIVLHWGFAESSGKQIKFMSENPAETKFRLSTNCEPFSLVFVFISMQMSIFLSLDKSALVCHIKQYRDRVSEKDWFY